MSETQDANAATTGLKHMTSADDGTQGTYMPPIPNENANVNVNPSSIPDMHANGGEEDAESFHDAVDEDDASDVYVTPAVSHDENVEHGNGKPDTNGTYANGDGGNDLKESSASLSQPAEVEVDDAYTPPPPPQPEGSQVDNCSDPPTPESAVLVSPPESETGEEEQDHPTPNEGPSEDPNVNETARKQDPEQDVPIATVGPSSTAASPAQSNTASTNTNTRSPSKPTPSGAGTTPSRNMIPCHVRNTTPIRNSDTSLRLLRKFISKTAPHFPTSYGGTKGSTILSFFFGPASGSSSGTGHIKDECSACYKDLVDILLADVGEDGNEGDGDREGEEDTDGNGGADAGRKEEDDVMIESILGHSGDTMSKARLAIASFCRLLEIWCLETRKTYMNLHVGIVARDKYEALFERTHFYKFMMDADTDHAGNVSLQEWIDGSGDVAIGGDIIVAALDCAEGLVAHGCLDGVMLEIGHGLSSEGGEENAQITFNLSLDDSFLNDDDEEGLLQGRKTIISAATVVCESIYLCYLESEAMELATLKFLLTAGCRTTDGSDGVGEIMLQGSLLLQAIRVCYRLYLSTVSAPNKITAKAALRQIVTGTFKRLELKDEIESKNGGDGADHEDSGNGMAGPTTAPDVADGEDPFSHAGHEKEGTHLLQHPSSKIDADDVTLKSRMSTTGNFPSFEHKDAYLVLRSLCKLSMKAVTTNPDDAQIFSSSVLISRNQSSSANSEGVLNRSSKNFAGQAIMMDPALDSKILSLDLILEVLQRSKTETLMNAGPHLIYAVRNYLCHSLLKNCTSDNTFVVDLSLQLFVPLIQHFRAHLKTEIEAFVTNVFFVILDSKNSPVEHKLRVVVLFEEICSDPAALAEIFLNYDCDLSAVDLFQRIVNTLARVAKIGLHDQGLESTSLFISGTGASRAEKTRQNHRKLRLEAMKAVKKILSSLHSSIDSMVLTKDESVTDDDLTISSALSNLSQIRNMTMPGQIVAEIQAPATDEITEKKSLVQIYDSKKKRKEDLERVCLKFNQKPKAGLKLASQVGFIDEDDPNDVAQFLLSNKESLDKTQIGEFLGMPAEYKDGFTLKVLHSYANAMDFTGLTFDDAIKFYLSGFRLPGEAQKIDRIMEKFAERYTTQNPDIFPTADAAFILAFSVIMLNTDLHNPSIKEERRMTKAGFLRNNSGICDGQDLPEELLSNIFDRIKEDPISLKEDDEAREKIGDSNNADLKVGPSGLFTNNYDEMDKKRETDFQKEKDEILRNTESLLRRKKRGKSGSFRGSRHFVSTQDSGMKDEYVIPMFDVAWGPALAVFSTVIESANGTMGSLLSIATDHEIEYAAENAASATEVCLEGFTLAIRIAALCGNDTARSAYVHALSNFSLLGTTRLLEHRHVRCVQMLLELSRDDGELLGPSWEYIFKALSEIARLNQVYEDGAKFVREQAAANTRRLKRQEAAERQASHAATQEVGSDSREDIENNLEEENLSDSDEYDSFDDYDSILAHELHDGHLDFDEEMDRMAIDEINARTIYENIPEDLPDEIFSRSSALSAPAMKDFIFQLCRVSRMEISGYGGHVGNKANFVDLTAVHYRKQHTLIGDNGGFEDRRNQPDIYCLQKLIEVTHYNMDTRPRLVFSDMWNIVSAHLTSTALHSNAAVAMYAVDSFRQLSMQFLKRQELGVFEFQRKFIKPFEGVMLKCKNASVKEFLLKSVEQIIVMYGSDEDISGQDASKMNTGLLKSGWRPLLAVIGQASCDSDDAIANLGFSMLTSQLSQSLMLDNLSENDTENEAVSNFAAKSPMRADKFVDLVEALLMYVSGLREDMSAESIDHLVTLCKYLADDSIALPQNFKKTHLKAVPLPESVSHPSVNEELELWWPILLGLSKSVGDVRPNIRIKGLITLLAIINQHFFATSGKPKEQSALVELQTLQLIFRGVLTPCLEHADSSAHSDRSKLTLPDGFIRFMTRGTLSAEAGKGGRKDRIDGKDTSTGNNWIDTTFDHLMDGAVALTLRSIDVYKTDALVEEMLAMFNTCLISDSSSLAIRGLKRLYHFVANDLVLENVTDNTWATVCHMLRRCLAVGGLPSSGDITLNSEMIGDFLQEEKILPHRRYIGSNATSIIGSLLTNEEIANAMGPKWYLFLYSGLGIGVCTWDKAAEIFDMHPLQANTSDLDVQPPQYAENSLYARKWLVRLLLKLISGQDIIFGPKSTSDKKTKRMIRDEIKSLVNSYLKKESLASSGESSPGKVLELEHMTKMVVSLLDGIAKLDSLHITFVSSLTPTLSACIQTDDRSVRAAVHVLLKRIFQLAEDEDD